MLRTKRKKTRRQTTQKKSVFIFQLILFLAIAISLGVVVKPILFKDVEQTDLTLAKEQAETDIYLRFLFEIYDKIQENYWNKVTDEELAALYRTGIEKIVGAPQILESGDKNGLKKVITEITENMAEDKKKEFTVQLAQIVLYNLEPVGRSGLYTEKDEESLKNQVQNIDPSTDLYANLGVKQGASEEEVKESYEKRVEEFNQIIKDENRSEEEKQTAEKKLAQAERAFETLADKEKKENYDQAGVEATVSSKLIGEDISYIHLKKMSPNIFNEFQAAAEAVDQGERLDTLILDLRGNIGGSIDLMQYFLGPFIGPDQYAYEFYHQGEREPYKTKIGWMNSLVRYKKVVVLVDEQTQSSAEIMAATLKRYNVGVLVGTRTRGWGTVERVFELETQIDEKEKYSMFLVHRITLRDDNQPIEGRGIDPVINIGDPDWQDQLLAYFDSKRIVNAVKNLLEE